MKRVISMLIFLGYLFLHACGLFLLYLSHQLLALLVTLPHRCDVPLKSFYPMHSLLRLTSPFSTPSPL